MSMDGAFDRGVVSMDDGASRDRRDRRASRQTTTTTTTGI